MSKRENHSPKRLKCSKAGSQKICKKRSLKKEPKKNAEDIYKISVQLLLTDDSRSKKKGISYLKKAADMGHAKAQYNLGIFFFQGMQGISQSLQEAYRYFSLAAQQRHIRANYMMGCYFALGLLFAPCEESAIHYFRISADANDAEAQYNLGTLLLKTQAAKFMQEGASYLQLSANQGNADAQYNLGLCYFKGIGVTQSHEKAVYYLELAVKQKHPKAASSLEHVLMTTPA
jgi:uncharacterized protein